VCVGSEGERVGVWGGGRRRMGEKTSHLHVPRMLQGSFSWCGECAYAFFAIMPGHIAKQSSPTKPAHVL
jgi:uncharacterized protein YuzB (UPF0349 family)